MIAATLYPNTKTEDLTDEQRQTVSALSTLAAGLAGGLAGGDAAGAMAGAQAGQNAVDNNHLSDIERVSLDMDRKQYAQGCQGAAGASTECQKLRTEINALEDKGASILQEELISVGSDMGTDLELTHIPGSVVPCAGSANGYCVVTSETKQTPDGPEWRLAPATDIVAQAQMAEDAALSAQADKSAQALGQKLFESGCGGVGPASALCQAYFTAGGTNPFTGEQDSLEQRIVSGAGLLLGLVPFLSLNTKITKGAKETASFFELATADDLASARAKYNLPDGNTIAVARADIPGFESEVLEGLSPVLRRNSGLPSLDELYGEARAIKSPYNNPLFTRHAEEDLFNSVAGKIDKQGLTSGQLDGKVLDVRISNASGICNKCSAGLAGNSDLNGVVKQFSERYPTLLLRVTAEGGTAMPNRLTVLVKDGKIINGK